MPAFYAHSVSNRPEAEWEALPVHLREVAAEAAYLAAQFGAGAAGEMAGLLHDLGKYSDAFQRRLHGGGRADHSTAGAAWALAQLPAKWGGLVAHAVAGHHAGLKDGLLGIGGRLHAKAEVGAEAARLARGDGLELAVDPSWPDGFPRFLKDEGGFQRAFLTRMIFSCLVDADRRCTARFEAAARGEAIEEEAQPSIAALEKELGRWFAGQPTATRDLDRLRDQVRAEAMARAGEEPGVFTLTVPTGGGKTLTSLAFALAHARANGLERVVVVIPFTSVIEQTAAVYRKVLGALGVTVLEHHSAFEMANEGRWSEGRVGPERLGLAMERWDRPIVVTTAVQFFESLFASRTSRCRKLHSLAKSVVVLDEAQTMPLPLLRPCVAALKELCWNYGSSVVLCTATQPALLAGATKEEGFAGGFRDARELVRDVPDLFARLRRVTLRCIGEQDDAALAERIARAGQVLCIVNQRAHARALFAAIRHLPGAHHLSTCMHSVHRQRVLAVIRDDLTHGRPCRVVSTSLIEAGVDIDFPLVMRAEAGLDQIAQAAGRCNREFGRPAGDSEVLVFVSREYPVIRPLRKNAEAGAEMLRTRGEDPFSPDTMRAFFELLYWRHGKEALDRGGVIEMTEERRGDLDFPFETIATEMRFIDEEMAPVIVPVEDGGEVRPLLARLPYATGTGGIARRLGRYAVGVPRKARLAMIAAGAATCVAPDQYADQFVVLENLDLYGTEAGLNWTDLSFRTVESLIAC